MSDNPELEDTAPLDSAALQALLDEGLLPDIYGDGWYMH